MSKRMADLTESLIAHKEENAQQHLVLKISIDQVIHDAKVNNIDVQSSIEALAKIEALITGGPRSVYEASWCRVRD